MEKVCTHVCTLADFSEPRYVNLQLQALRRVKAQTTAYRVNARHSRTWTILNGVSEVPNCSRKSSTIPAIEASKMALLTLRAPVDYAAQQSESRALIPTDNANAKPAAFEDFLTGYKSTATDLEIPSNALQGLNIDGDNTSDEYDFMDDAIAAKEKQRPTGAAKGPRRKYMDQLQEVADRKRDEVLIELDDVDNVGSLDRRVVRHANNTDSMKRAWARTWA